MRHLATDPTLNQPVENPEPPRDTTDWEDCTPLGDRGVLKRVIRSGNADAGVPIDGWCVKVNYDAYIEGGWFHGRKVDTTRDRADEDGDYQFLVGDTHEAVTGGWVIKGLNYGCLNMHRGERAELVIAPSMRTARACSRPKSPECDAQNCRRHAHVVAGPLGREEHAGDALVGQLELAHATEDSANEHFREGQPEEARAVLEGWDAHGRLRPGTDIQMPSDRIEEQNALALTCWLNEAMCYIRMAQNEEATGMGYKGRPTGSSTSPTLWRKAIARDAAFKLDPDNVKGHYRKGLALAHLHEFDEAQRHLERARAGNPSSKEIRSALDRLRIDRTSKEEQDRRMFQRVLRKSAGLYSERPDPVAIAEEPVHTSAVSTAPATSAAASTAASTGMPVGAASSAEMLLASPESQRAERRRRGDQARRARAVER